MPPTGESISLELLLFGAIFFYFGSLGIVKSIGILFFKKESFLPLFGMVFFVYQLIFEKKHPFYQKRLLRYKKKIMKPFAIYTLVVMPFIAALGAGWLFVGFRNL